MMISEKRERKNWGKYAVALLTIVAATAVTVLVPSLGDGGMYFLFLTAIIFSALRGDWRSGAFAAVLALILNFFLLYRHGRLPQSFGDWVVLFAFGLAAAFTVVICHAQMKAEAARLQAETRYRTIFENAITGIYETTLDGKYVEANPKLAEILGFVSPVDLMNNAENLNAVFYVEPGRRANFARLIEKNKTIAGFDSQIYRRDGVKIWVSENAVGCYDKTGNLTGFQGTTIDITARQKAEAALEKAHGELEEKVAERTSELEKANRDLREEIGERLRVEAALRHSEKMLQLVIDTIPQGVCWKDRDGVYLGCNIYVARRAGFDSCAQIVGKTDYDLPWTKEEAEFYRETDCRVMATGVAELELERAIRQTNGTELWTETNKVPLRNAADHIVGVLGTFKDITDQRRAEAALREKELHLRSVITSAPIVLLALDRDGVFTLFEGKGTEDLGIKSEDVVGSTIEVFQSDIPQLKEVCNRTTSSEEFTALLNFRDAIFEVRHIPLHDTNGEFAGTTGVAINVTERIHAENALLASQKRLRELSAHLQSVREEERKKLARELHDELGQTLTALKIDLVRLGEKTRGDEKRLPAEIKNKIPAMITAVDAAMDTTRKVVAELRPGALDELGLAAAMEWQTGEFQKRTRIKCALEIEFDETGVCMNIKTAIFRILQECLTNITRHSEATAAKITLHDGGSRIFLEVEDNGRGFDHRQAESKQTFGILGMRERALLLGGTAEIGRGETGGARVSVSIPLAPPPAN